MVNSMDIMKIEQNTGCNFQNTTPAVQHQGTATGKFDAQKTLPTKAARNEPVRRFKDKLYSTVIKTNKILYSI
jgi:hypothetical protein